MIGARAIAVARSPSGRLVAGACGLGAVAYLLSRIGLGGVGKVLLGAGPLFPLVVVMELGVLACTMMALRSTYGAVGARVPPAQLVRAGLIGYAVMGLVPAGRAAAEATRASLLARYVGGARAAAAAGRLQGVSLIANSIICVFAAVAAARSPGPRWLPLAVLGNSALTLVLGLAILVAGRRSGLGAWLGRRAPDAMRFGADLDVALGEGALVPLGPVLWELGGRVIQVAQNAVLIACVGGAVSVGGALTSEGVHLVGAAVGDLVPAQLGVIEGNFTLAAAALALPAAAALSIALLAHLAQLGLVAVGSLVPPLWPPPPARADEAAPPHASPTEASERNVP